MTSQIGPKKLVVHYYETLLSEHHLWRPKSDGLTFESFHFPSASWLGRPFEEDEVHLVVEGMARDKAPGPDSFSMAFFQDCWDVVKGDIMSDFHEFFSYIKFEKCLNTTLLALIPKRAVEMDVKDFCHISLVNGVYKITFKVLANRIKKSWRR